MSRDMLIQTVMLLLACGALPACQARESAPRGRDSSVQASPVTASLRPPVRSALPNDSLVGDTVILVGFGPQSLPDALAANPPCNERSIPVLERLVFVSDSMYDALRIERPGCRDPRMASSDTTEWGSGYRVHGDTLTLYFGDGDEVFESGSFRLFPDSLVGLASDPVERVRYVRRRATRRT